MDKQSYNQDALKDMEVKQMYQDIKDEIKIIHSKIEKTEDKVDAIQPNLYKEFTKIHVAIAKLETKSKTWGAISGALVSFTVGFILYIFTSK